MRSGYDYPPDEFDAAARTTGPRGVHRAPRSRWSRWWPFAVVLVLFPLLAYAGVTWLSDWDGLPGDDGPTVAAPPTDPTPTPTEATEEPAPDPEPEPEPTTEPPPPPPDLTTVVAVYNGTTIAGLAADGRDRLEEAGFAEVRVGNWGAADPPASVVYYATPEAASTAALVAETLGIAAVEESAELAAEDALVVVLMEDYEPA